jgi:hypothetical protein
MTQEEMIKAAIAKLPDANTFDGDRFSVKFNENPKSEASVIIDTNLQPDFNPNLPSVVMFEKVRKGEKFDWQLISTDWSKLINLQDEE